MSKRVFIPGLSVVCAIAMISSVATTALAQQVPVREVQGTDGTLYIVQGGKSWTVVPDQISDDDVAALSPTGEINGTFPNELFVVQSPTAAPAPAAPAPEAPAPGAPAPPIAPAPITGTVDLTGKAANGLPGTLIPVGAAVTSVIDANTKPKDVFAIQLAAGTSYRAFFTSTNNFGTPSGMGAQLVNPNTSVAVQSAINATIPTLSFTAAADGVYSLVMYTNSSGVKYTFSVKQQ